MVISQMLEATCNFEVFLFKDGRKRVLKTGMQGRLNINILSSSCTTLLYKSLPKIKYSESLISTYNKRKKSDKSLWNSTAPHTTQYTASEI